MPDKFKVVVSDLHLGAGPPTGQNPLEDFQRDRAFAAFLEEIAAESEGLAAQVELIFNGDTFEMLQVPHLDHFDPAVRYPPEQTPLDHGIIPVYRRWSVAVKVFPQCGHAPESLIAGGVEAQGSAGGRPWERHEAERGLLRDGLSAAGRVGARAALLARACESASRRKKGGNLLATRRVPRVGRT